VLGPVLAAFLFAVAKIYPPMNHGFFSDYRGAFFGGLALAVALYPGIRLPQLRERGAERGGSSPVTARARTAGPDPIRGEAILVGSS
jgi:hypothetical protein